MRKYISALLVATSIIASTVSANAALNKFYNESIGQWTVEGYYGDQNFCAAKTFWDNGSYFSVFNIKNSNDISVFVHNATWNIGDPSGTNDAYKTTLHFSGKYAPTSGSISYELIDSQTIILRNVNDAFLNDWVSYDVLELVMPGDIGRLKVGLNGTKALLTAFADCIDKLNAINA